MPSSKKAEFDALIKEQFPKTESIYLNTGSVGKKPLTVLQSIEESFTDLNYNPTEFTFLMPQIKEETRLLAASHLGVDPKNLLLLQNSTQGLQLIISSLAQRAGDEIVTTNHEHGSLRVILRQLNETKGVVVKRHKTSPFEGSLAMCQGILSLVTKHTKAVVVSEINGYAGWKPNLDILKAELKKLGIPLIADGAHMLGQTQCHPNQYDAWVTSCHKWLGGPNGTGLTYIAPQLVPLLKPIWLGDWYYLYNPDDLHRFESQGTNDLNRWLGLKAAFMLLDKIGLEEIQSRQLSLSNLLRSLLDNLPDSQIFTPDFAGEQSAMLTVNWPEGRLKTKDLRASLWQEHKIWIQPDFCFGLQENGMRVSCHYANSQEDLEKLIAALQTFLF